MRILTLTVTQQDHGRAVRSFVPRRFALGQHAYRRLKVMGGILVNGAPARADRILQEGDVVEIRLPSDTPLTGEAPAARESAAPPSFIRHIDEDLIIAAKGAPLPTLPASHIRGDTLREQIIALLHADPAAFIYHPVNRLDKGTSGLLCIARHAHAQRLLTQQLHGGSFVREYLAVTEGIPQSKEGTIRAPIARIGAGAKRAVMPGGRDAVTHYRVIKTGGGRALLRLRLETGRTHQIRVHLSHIGCPIAGDYLYGAELSALPGRFALHSAYLSLVHPITKTRIELSEPLPRALELLLE